MPPTPEENRNSITELKGEVQTMRAELEGEIKRQGDNLEAVKDVASRIENTVSGFIQASKGHHQTHFESSKDHGEKLTAIDGRLNGHEAVCEERDESIQMKIDTGFTALQSVLYQYHDSQHGPQYS